MKELGRILHEETCRNGRGMRQELYCVSIEVTPKFESILIQHNSTKHIPFFKHN